MKWILLVAWMGGGHSASPAALVAGFASEELCLAAMTAFNAAQDKASVLFEYRRAAVCVRAQ